MVDTAQTKADLITAFADNATHDIAEQNLRDLLVSIMGGYGHIAVVNGSTAQTGISSTPAKLTCWTTNELSDNTTPDQANNEIVVGITGVYMVGLNCSFSGSNGTEFDLHIAVNGTLLTTKGKLRRKIGAGGDVGSSGITPIPVALTAGDAVSIYISVASGSKSATVEHADFVVNRKS